MEVWKAKPGARITDKDAEVIAPIIAQLFDAGRGTPDDIVQIARDDSSPLHRYFTWDDALAACAHRKQEARVLTNSIAVEVIVDGKERLLSAFESIHVVVDTHVERRYDRMSEIVGDEVKWDMLRMDILRELRAAQRKLGDYESLANATQLRLIDEAVAAFQ